MTKQICGAQTKQGNKCQLSPIEGNKRCKFHGGLSTGRPATNGSQENPNGPNKRRLSERAQRFAALSNPLDLNRELSYMRALFEQWLETHDEDTYSARATSQALEILRETGALIERIERIRNATALTQSEIKYLHLKMAQLIAQYLPNPKQRREFVQQLRQITGAPDEEEPTAPVILNALGSGQNIINPREIGDNGK